MKGETAHFLPCSGASRLTKMSREPSSPAWWASPGFLHSLPLFVLAIVLFAAGVAVRFALPTYGPGVFTLWGLLLVLGFISTIGGVLSWTLASEPSAATVADPAPTTAPAYLPIEFPESPPGREAAARLGPARSRPEFGRPTPETRSAIPAGGWSEGPADSERTVALDHPTSVVVQPVAESPPASDERFEPVGSVLAALESIERDLAPRNRSAERSTS
jgi:hypothetical protein